MKTGSHMIYHTHKGLKEVISLDRSLFRFKIGMLLGAPGKNRTCDTRIRNPVLYPLSYEGCNDFNEL